MRISHHIEQGITELLLANGKNEVRGEFWDSIFKLSNKNVTFHKLLRIAELCERGNWL